jgi:aspartate-semialdehyde dehydrogenase
MRCAVVGATGVAGQQFLAALEAHPDIELVRLAASERSAGKTYREALTSPSGQLGWVIDGALPERFADMRVESGDTMDVDGLDLVFSAVESDAARALEARFAAKLPVISTASAYRYEDDVPILIPAVNGGHAALIDTQRARRGWKGFVVPIPNCTTTGLAIAIAPLHRRFGVEKVIMTSMQAVSGAGRSPGVIGLDIVDNIIPFIPKEEEKVALETKKLLGAVGASGVEPAPMAVSCTCTRVAVLEGHTEAVTVSLRTAASPAEAAEAMREFGREIGPDTHPSAPAHWITVLDDPYRPQVRRDRDAEQGMTTSVGRLRPDDVLGPHGLRFVLVSHNTRMGAARGAVLVAEDLARHGYLG